MRSIAAGMNCLNCQRKIHDHPELGFEEFQAVEAISSVLEHHGFQVQKGYGGLQTAFRADKAGKGKGPNVAFLAEYDALRWHWSWLWS